MYKSDIVIFSDNPGKLKWTLLICVQSVQRIRTKQMKVEIIIIHRLICPFWPWDSLMSRLASLNFCVLHIFKDHYTFSYNVLKARILSSECFDVLTEISSEGLRIILLLLDNTKI